MPIVNPQVLTKFSRLELLAKQVVEGFITGLHKSPFHGFSVEFAEHRLYNTGESTRHIDWKLFARSEKLFVKRYEEETNLRCQLVIDHSGSMYFPIKEGSAGAEQQNKINFGIQCCASLVELLKRQRDAVGLSIFSNQLESHLPAKSNPVHHKLLFNRLEELMSNYNEKEKRATSAASALHQIAEVTHKRSLIVLFSDMLESSEKKEELFSALQHLKHKKHEVILFHVSDKAKELEFEFENRPYRFIDMESGEEIKLNPSNLKEQYQSLMSKQVQELKLRCAQFKIDLVEADINEGFEKVLYAYLIKRSAML